MLSEVPEGWRVRQLGEVCSPKQHPILQRRKFCSEGYPVYGANGLVGFYSEYTHSEKTIAIGCRGTCGTINIVPPMSYITGNAMALDSLDESTVTVGFLSYYLRHFGVDACITGSAQPQITRSALLPVELLVPPLNEQHRIAEILSSVDASIQATQAVIAQAERVKRGLMEKLLTGGLGSEAIERGEVPEGWEATTIGAVCEIVRGGSPRPIDKFMTDAEDGINWIKIGDASASSKYIYTTKEKIKPEGEKKSRRVHSGDFLLSNSMSFGRPYILRTDGCIHDGWLSLSFDRQALGEEFLYYLLSSPLVFNQFSDKAAGSAVKNLNKDLVSSVKIALPPYEEQKRIEETLCDLDALMLSQRTLIEQQNRTKRGLMDDLLTGKVRTV